MLRVRKRRYFMAINSVEILYCIGSSADRRGKRVIVRERGVENCIFPEDGIQDIDSKLLGITQKDKQHIERFFSKRAKS